MKNLLLCIIVTTCVMLFSAHVHSAVTAYEYFDYSGTTIVGENGGSGWSTAWTVDGGNHDVDAGYTDGWLTNSAYTFAPAGGFVKTDNIYYFPYRSLTTSLDLSVDANYYISFLSSAYESSTDNHLEFIGTDRVIAGFREDGGGKLTGRVVCGSGTQAMDGTYDLGENCFMVAKIEAHATGNDYIHMSIYTDSDTVPGTEPATYQITSTGADLSSSLTGVILKNGGNNNDGNPCCFDDIRIGESWADVTIPEPGMMMGIIAGLIFLIRRK